VMTHRSSTNCRLKRVPDVVWAESENPHLISSGGPVEKTMITSAVEIVSRVVGGAWDSLPFKRIILEPFRRIGIFPESVYRHLHFHGVFKTRVGDASFVIRTEGDRLENEVFWSGVFGDFEGQSFRLWAAIAEKVGVVLDVGANTGIYALVAQAVNPTATVVAFEPLKRVFCQLEENVRLNGGTVRCVRAAVTERTGPLTIFDPGGRHPSASSIDPSVFGPEVGHDWDPVDVAGLRLDQFLKEAQLLPQLLKVDVEGHEPAVLRGLGDLLGEHHPALLIEVLREEKATEIWDLLGNFGYSAYDIDEVTGPKPLPRGSPNRLGRNILFCSEEMAIELDLPTA